MRRLGCFFFLLLPIGAQDAAHRENTEWTDVWMPHANDHDLPRVLLLGDSITRAYYPSVEEKLKGKAYVARIATSKALGDPALLEEVAVLVKEATFDVIHFNIGMHGWAYTEEEYRRTLPELIAVLRKAAPKARLVWASTTPVRKDVPGGASNRRIVERNAIARKVAGAGGIEVDDLHLLMAGRGELHSDDIHFNKDGSALMAEQVAKFVSPAQ